MHTNILPIINTSQKRCAEGRDKDENKGSFPYKSLK